MPERHFRAASPLRTHFRAPLPADVAADPSNPKWIQLCAVGSYVYRGQPIEITPATFDEMVVNFRTHPSFDPAGRSLFGKAPQEVAPLVLGGKYGVIALNFDHPPVGGPRPGHGWFLDVERRDGTLWGLCFFDAEAHAGMLAGAWKWTSIEWADDTTAPTGEKIGAYLSGVALTNDPFIQGMTPIQLSRPGITETSPTLAELIAMLDERDRAYVAALPPEQVATDPRAKRVLDAARAKAATMAREPVVFFGPATDVLCELRYVLNLGETADLGAVIGELAKLKTWALGEMAAPLGVDVGGLVARIRGLLNLPTLCDAASIFGELDKLLARLAAETPEEIMPPIPDQNAPQISQLARRLASRLSAKLGTPVGEDEPALDKAFDAMSSKYDEAMNAKAGLEKVFGTADPKVIAKKLADLSAMSEQMTALLGEVAAEHEAEEQAEGEMAQADVATVMQAQRLDPRTATGTVKAYTMQRLGNPAKLTRPTAEQIAADPASAGKYLAAVRVRREERSKAREAFLSEHGILDMQRVQDALPAHLKGAFTGALFGGQGAAFGPGEKVPGTPPPPANTGGSVWTFDRVRSLPPDSGRNDSEKIFAEVVRTEFGGKAPPGSPAYDRAWARAGEIYSNLRAS